MIGTTTGIPAHAPARETGAALIARREPPKLTRLAEPAYPHRLVVKFRDALRARATPDGRVVSGADSDLKDVAAIAARHGATFRPLIALPAETVDFVQARAAANSGRAQPDLLGLMAVSAPSGALARVADELLASPLTEWVEFEEDRPPPPGCPDLYPPTPDYKALGKQFYHGVDPGLNMVAARDLGSARGGGIRIADCEYGYTMEQEDLCNVIPEPGLTFDEILDHGTAVLGAMSAPDNGFGVMGLAPDAEPYFFSEFTKEWGGRRTECIVAAIAALRAGDVIVLEMQVIGAGGGYAPAEHSYSIWLVTRVAADTGMIVVGAAGNGNQDLDSPDYEPYMSFGDSGAIIVGAGQANTMHNKLDYSTYGSRVDVQGWGEAVFTLGYGDFAMLGSDVYQSYTAQFNGTSSATALIGGAVAALQSRAVAVLGRPLKPGEARELLIETGVPQGTGGHIGPFPDIYAAAMGLGGLSCRPDCNADGQINVNDFVCFHNKWYLRDPYGDYDRSGSFNVNDFVKYQQEFRKGCK